MSILRKALQAAASPLEVLPEAGARRRQYRFDAGSVVFAGHFPGHPVLPAVTQLLMVQMTLEEALGGPLELCAVIQAKFTAPLGPDDVIELRIQEGRRAGQWDGALHRAGAPASRFQIAVQAASV
jgi:3-hydroxyacyl-[acyl-carrier-protein] dehydratase